MLVLAAALACASRVSAQPPPHRIPNLQGTTLAGDPIALPAALTGKVGILIIGFSRDSRAPAAAWGKRLAQDFDHTPNVLYLELPVLEEVPRFLRGVVLHAIRRELSPFAQAHFVPITANEDQWKSVAHFAEPSAAYVLVVDSIGNVRWRTSGTPTDDRYAALRQAVSSTLTHTPPTP